MTGARALYVKVFNKGRLYSEGKIGHNLFLGFLLASSELQMASPSTTRTRQFIMLDENIPSQVQDEFNNLQAAIQASNAHEQCPADLERNASTDEEILRILRESWQDDDALFSHMLEETLLRHGDILLLDKNIRQKFEDELIPLNQASEALEQRLVDLERNVSTRQDNIRIFRKSKHDHDSLLLHTLEGVLFPHFGILSSDEEELAQSERLSVESAPLSTLATPPLPNFRGNTRRSERIARRNIARTCVAEQNLLPQSSPSSPSPATRLPRPCYQKETAATSRARKSRPSRRAGSSKLSTSSGSG